MPQKIKNNVFMENVIRDCLNVESFLEYIQ